MTNHVFNIYNPPRRSSFVDDYPAAIDAEIRKLAGFTATPPQWIADPYWRACNPPRKGDKVEVVLTGYVDRVDVDGNVHLVDKRTPFKDEAKFVGVGPSKDGDGFTVRVVERAPAAPKVGDVITGAQIKATPWKRGTQIKFTGSTGGRYVLTSEGEWRSVESGDLFPFAAFAGSAPRWLVEYAPGK